MNRHHACQFLALLLLAGCTHPNAATDDPSVKTAPPLKPGVHSLAPQSPEVESPAAEVPTADLPRSPDVYQAKFSTTKGDFVVEVNRDWAPNAADRFHQLVSEGYYDDVKFFRAVAGFMVQFGISGDPAQNKIWRERKMPDDPVTQSNQRGTITFATSGPHSRTTQLFINYADNARLDGMGFSPFGKVVEGMDVVDALNQEYDEEPSRYQQQIQEQGNAFLEQAFPRLDAIKTVQIVAEPEPSPAEPGDAKPEISDTPSQAAP